MTKKKVSEERAKKNRKLRRYIRQAEEYQKSVRRRQLYYQKRFTQGKIGYLDYARKYAEHTKKHDEYKHYIKKTRQSLESPPQKVLRVTGRALIATVLVFLLAMALIPVGYDMIQQSSTDLSGLFKAQFYDGGITGAQSFGVSAIQDLNASMVIGTCPAGSADVLHIANLTGGHAELPTQSNLGVRICVRDLSAKNTISTSSSGTAFLNLVNVTSAHVEQANQSVYVNIAYIDASVDSILCDYRATNSCDSNQTCVASLSAITNAHIGACGNYNRTICCGFGSEIDNPPTIDAVILNSTFTTNSTNENLTAYRINVSDFENASVKNITNWFLNGSSATVLNMPFEAHSNSATNATDYSGFGNNGTVFGATFNLTGGVDGFGTYDFDGSGDYIESGSQPELISFGTGDFAIEFWLNSTGNSTEYQQLVFYGETGNFVSNIDRYLVQIVENDDATNGNKIRFQITGTEADEIFSNSNISGDNIWHHVVAQRRSGTTSLHIDGTQQAQTAANSEDLAENASSTFRIGRGWDDFLYFFTGNMDEVKIWNRSLSTEQIVALYSNRTDLIVSNETSVDDTWQACVTPNDGVQDGSEVCSNNLSVVNLVPSLDAVILNSTFTTNLTAENLTAHPINVSDFEGDAVNLLYRWLRNSRSYPPGTVNGTINYSDVALNMPFENYTQTSDTSKDYSIYENNGTEEGGIFWNASGGFDGFGAYEFDGVDDLIDIGDTVNVGTGDFSFAFWVKAGTQNTNGVILSDAGTTSPSDFPDWQIILRTDDQILYQFDLSVGNEYSRETSVNWTDEQWHHHVFVWDNSLGNGSAYQDGQQVSTLDVSSSGDVSGGNFTSANNFLIGARNITASPLHFNGSLDDLQLFSRALTAQQVLALYENRTELIVSEETEQNELWQACVTPNDGFSSGSEVCSNTLTINSPPSLDAVILNSTFGTNLTSENLTAYPINVSDLDGHAVDLSNQWLRNQRSYAAATLNGTISYANVILNMPFENYTKLDDTFTDYSAYANNATENGSVFWNATAGQDGFGAYNFDGSSAFLQLPEEDFRWQRNRSFVLWARSSGVSAFDIIIGKEVEWQLTNDASGSTDFGLFCYGVGANVGGTVDLSDQDWHHIAMVTNDTDYCIYGDGSLVSCVSFPSCTVATNEFAFGQSMFPGFPHYFAGDIDEVLFYNVTLSSSEISDLYNSRHNIIVTNETSAGEVWQACVTPNDGSQDGSEVCSNNLTIANAVPSLDAVILNSSLGNNATSENLTAHPINVSDLDGDVVKNITNWFLNSSSIAVLNMPFEGGSTSGSPGNNGTTKDYSGLGNNGSVVNATFNSTGGFDGFGAYEFDGVDDFIDVGNDNSLKFGTGAFSLEVWFMTDGSTGRGMVIGSSVEANNFYSLEMNAFANDGVISFGMGDGLAGCPNGNSWVNSTASLADGIWHHVVATNDGSDNQSLYVDGILNASATEACGSLDSSDPVILGRTFSGGFFYNGTIGEARIWNRSLSSDQILALYENRTDLIVSNETSVGETWQACVTPNDGVQDGSEVCSNNLTILQEPNFLIGNESNVTTTGVANLNITLDGGDDLSGGLTGNHFVTFYDGSELFMNFTHNFSLSSFDLSNVSVVKSFQGVAVNISGQLPVGENKSLFLTDIGFGFVCVEDAEISSLDDISSSCTDSGEIKFVPSECSPASSKFGITCNLTSGVYRIDGLNNSGVEGNSPPNISQVILNSTLGINSTSENLTAYPIGIFDNDSDPVKNITNWFLNGSSIAVLNMPFEGGSTSGTPGSNGTTKDYSGLDKNGTVLNATFNSTGGFDGLGAYEFDGVDDQIEVTSHKVLPFPKSFEFRFFALSSSNFDPFIREENGSLIRMFNDQTTFDIWSHIGPDNDYFATPSSTFSLNEWNHVVVVLEGNTTGTLYLNAQNESLSFTQVTTATTGDTTLHIGKGDSRYFNGSMDEVRIYNRSLTTEQIQALYNNFTEVIVTNETAIGQVWQACVTPNDGLQDGSEVCSNNLTIVNAAPSIDAVIVNSTFTTNFTAENLTAYPINVSDLDGDAVKNITNWFVNGTSIAALNMPFEGGSTSGSPSSNGTTKDYTPFENNGSVLNATHNSTGGYDGFGAYQFDGLDDFIDVFDDASLDITGPITVTAWVNFRTLAPTAQYFVSKYLSSTDDRSWAFYTLGDELEFWLSSDGTSNLANRMAETTSTTNLQADTWYHVAAVYDTSPNIDIYVNGTLQATTTAGSETSIHSGTAPVTISGDALRVWPTNGTIDDVKVYNRSLSPEQILALYENRTDIIVSNETSINETWLACVTPNDGSSDGSEVCSNNLTILAPNQVPTLDAVILNSTFGTNFTTENLTAHPINVSDLDGDAVKNITNWFVNGTSFAVLNVPFEGGSTSGTPGSNGSTKDYSGLDNNGTVVNVTFNSTGGPDGFGSVEFNQSGDKVIFPTTSDHNLGPEFSIEAWYKREGSTGIDEFLVSKFEAGGWALLLRPADNTIQWAVFGVGSAFSATITPDNEWHHTVVTRDNTGNLSIYYDGNLSTTTEGIANVSGSGIPLILGSRSTSLGSTLNGSLGTVRIYNKTLSASQVSALFEGNSSHATITSNETSADDIWQACVTPNDGSSDGSEVCSNNLTIVNAIPSIDAVIVNSTFGTNLTTENLTAYAINASDLDGEAVKNITNWFKNGASLPLFNMPFEADGNQNTTDYAFGNNATVNGNPLFNSSGGADGFGTYELDGVDDDFSIADNAIFDTIKSVSVWVKSVDTFDGTGPSRLRAIFSKRQNGGNFQGWIMVMEEVPASGGYFYITNDPGAASAQLTSTNFQTFSADVWYHLVFVYDGLASRVYVNGVEDTQDNDSASIIHDFATSLLIAEPYAPSASYTNFNGTIDEVQFFNHSLSSAQVAALYANRTDLIVSQETVVGEVWGACMTPTDGNAQGSQVCSNNVTISNNQPTIAQVILNSTLGTNFSSENLTAYPITVADLDGEAVKNITSWLVNGSSIAVLNMPFESIEPNTTGTKDYSSFGNNGTINGASFERTGGFDGFGAYVFDGVDDRINVSDDASFDTIGTVVFRFNPAETFEGTGADRTEELLFKRQTISPFTGWLLAVEELTGGSGRIFLTNDQGATPANSTSSLPFNFSAGTWYHVAFVLNDTNTSKVFVDGVEVTNTTDPATSLADFATDLRIGRGEGISGETPFNGSIDDITFYNRTLSPEQVIALFNNQTELIVSQETGTTEVWQACITPNDGAQDGSEVCSNNVTINSTPPTLDAVILNSTFGTNITTENLTAHPINVSDLDGDNVKNITDWHLYNGSSFVSIAPLHLPFDGGSDNTTTKDYSVFGTAGSIDGMTFNSTGGFDGFGAYADGADADLMHLSLDNVNSSVGSVEMRFRITADSVDLGTLWSISNNASAALSELRFGIDQRVVTTDIFAAGIIDGTTAFSISIDESVFNAKTDTDWHHLVMVQNGSAVVLYLDGAEEGTTGTTDMWTANLSNAASPADVNTIGGLLRNGATTQSGFRGLVDDFRMYNRALSADQVLALYNNRTDIITSDQTSTGDIWEACVTPNDKVQDGSEVCSNNLTINSPPTLDAVILNSSLGTNTTAENLTAYPINVSDLDGDNVKNITNWFVNGSSIAVLNMAFEGGSVSGTASGVSNGAKDYSGLQNNGTVFNATFNSSGGFDGFGAYEFDGFGAIEINRTPALDSLSTQITIEARIFITGPTGATQVIVIKGDNSAHPIPFQLDVDSNNQLRFFQGQASSFATSIIGGTVLQNNTWYHVVATNDGTTAMIYVNGVVDGTDVTPATVGDPDTENLGIGSAVSSSIPARFNGSIDEVRIYNRSLSLDQILALYNNFTEVIVTNETAVGQVWQACVTPNDALQDGSEVCSNNLTVLSGNTEPGPPTLVDPPNNGTTVDRQPRFRWNNSVDPEADNLTYQLVVDNDSDFSSPEINITGINETTTNSSFSDQSTILDVDEIYFWRVRANDSALVGNFSTTFNFSLPSFVAVASIRANINFSSVAVGTSENTTDNTPLPFLYINDGNVPINLTITGTRLFTSVSFPTSSYQFQVAENETGSFNVSQSTTIFTNITNVSGTVDVRDLDWPNATDDFETDILVSVPSKEAPGVLNSTITFEQI